MRRGAVALFFVGVGCAFAFGCFVAAYDLWGGIPRGLSPVAHALFVTALICVLTGAFRWIVSFPSGERRRATFRAVLGLAVAAVILGGGLIAYYAIRWESSKRICAPALIAPTRAEREAARREGLGPLFPVIDPHYTCLQLEHDRIDLERSGTCPTFVMDDVPCACGPQRWTGRDRKNDGPAPYQALGCAEENNWTLRDARIFQK